MSEQHAFTSCIICDECVDNYDENVVTTIKPERLVLAMVCTLRLYTPLIRYNAHGCRGIHDSFQGRNGRCNESPSSRRRRKWPPTRTTNSLSSSTRTRLSCHRIPAPVNRVRVLIALTQSWKAQSDEIEPLQGSNCPRIKSLSCVFL